MRTVVVQTQMTPAGRERVSEIVIRPWSKPSRVGHRRDALRQLLETATLHSQRKCTRGAAKEGLRSGRLKEEEQEND
ncbi:hypothetical protein T10_6649 [Trichinella papuae]|uniref:Uncharacterized protein n=1 Tax=Trichinella papuae TaxID=268474 RepID=A0A0V1MJ32_9BILA|nr:hypothetical protein T10_6649 [Trichinella papuae]